MGPLMRDLRTAYSARMQGRPPEWAALPVQYADYAVWQREQLGDENDAASTIARQLAYWSAALADLPDAIRLPTDRPRPAQPAHHGGSVDFDLGPQLYRDLLELADRMHCSLFMVLQAGLAVLLTRYGAGTDIPLGCPVIGRSNRKLDDLIGFFANTLVLRIDTSGDPTFEDLLSLIRARSLEAHEQQDVPFELLVERLSPARSLARHPLFQVLLHHNGSPAGAVPWPGGLATEPASVGTPVAVFDLAIQFVEGSLDSDDAGDSGAVSLLGEIEFNADIFESQTVERLAGSLKAIYRAMADDPRRRIGDAEPLT
jgi:non-ribosomal peptide synthetase component F